MRKIKRYIKSLFYVPKYEKESDKSFSRIMFSSVFGILICGICLGGLTWAWFSSSVTNTANKITSADFFAQTAVKNNADGSEITASEDNGSYTLETGNYTVTVTAKGNASTGYCTVKLGESTYHTVQLYTDGIGGKSQSVEFTVTVSDNTELFIILQWGTYAKPENEKLIGTAEDCINSIPEITVNTEPQTALSYDAVQTTAELTDHEQSYTVKQDDTLSGIAAKYGITVKILSAYNGIDDSDMIKAGDTVKIPPKSYKPDEAVASQPSAASSAASEPQKQTSDNSSGISSEESESDIS